jgi:hypothetical protein
MEDDYRERINELQARFDRMQRNLTKDIELQARTRTRAFFFFNLTKDIELQARTRTSTHTSTHTHRKPHEKHRA